MSRYLIKLWCKHGRVHGFGQLADLSGHPAKCNLLRLFYVSKSICQYIDLIINITQFLCVTSSEKQISGFCSNNVQLFTNSTAFSKYFQAMHHPVFSPVVPLCLLGNCLDNLVDLCRVQMVKLLVSRLGNDNANLNITNSIPTTIECNYEVYPK